VEDARVERRARQSYMPLKRSPSSLSERPVPSRTTTGAEPGASAADAAVAAGPAAGAAAGAAAAAAAAGCASAACSRSSRTALRPET